VGLTMINAVHQSRIERPYRFLLATLAFHANDEDGGDVFPSATRLAAALGVTETTVRHGLKALIERRVIQYDGFHGHTRRFRVNLEELQRYDPTTTAKRDRTARPGESEPCHRQQGSTDEIGVEPDLEPCRRQHGCPDGIRAQALSPAATNPVARGHEPCRPRPRTLSPAASTDHQDHQDHQDQKITGADAPGFVNPKYADENGRVADVYTAIAGRALERAVLERNDSAANITKHLQRICVAEAIPYDIERLQAATDAAIRAREQAGSDWIERARTISRERGGNDLRVRPAGATDDAR
jgi:hypothetical protein